MLLLRRRRRCVNGTPFNGLKTRCPPKTRPDAQLQLLLCSGRTGLHEKRRGTQWIRRYLVIDKKLKSHISNRFTGVSQVRVGVSVDDPFTFSDRGLVLWPVCGQLEELVVGPEQ
ncbi:hypothetical protein F2P81_001692 [Scophthalmus maximus]|uniref:Uncharacterized protein n=1 Tax=Scophthalmus maximus TaxID=52904 RepID=A0A6A4TGU7_SCOMX|nr:hypothetical protein F2P81_001692 [Scophthalmus maximus]